jgi:pimeloyl-ACP methyl ester carboxylesterase
MLRFFSTKIPKRASKDVMLRGEFLPCKYPDMPTVIAFPDLLEDPESLLPYFDKTFQENRNLWLLSYRNSWGSDRCDTMSAQELADDVMRFMDRHRITSASLFGHGFGARVATITGILKYHRVSSIVGIDYSPMDYTKHECWNELKMAIENAAQIDLTQDMATIKAQIN